MCVYDAYKPVWVCACMRYLLHGADEVLGGLADLPAHRGGPALIGGVGPAVAVHLHRVAGLGRPAQLVVHQEVDRKHIQTLEGVRRESGSGMFPKGSQEHACIS